MKDNVLIPLLGLLILVGCASGTTETTLDTLYEHNPIESTDVENIADDEFLVYYYSETCSYCKQFAPTILQYVQDGSLPLYMFDIYGQGRPISDKLREFLVGEGVEAVPTLVQYKKEEHELRNVWKSTGVIDYEDIGI